MNNEIVKAKVPCGYEFDVKGILEADDSLLKEHIGIDGNITGFTRDNGDVIRLVVGIHIERQDCSEEIIFSEKGMEDEGVSIIDYYKTDLKFQG
jgi:hypothetical protein